jgi:acetyl esterase/lipase
MPLMNIEEYPPQAPRPEASEAYLKRVLEQCRGIDGIDVAYGEDIYQHIALFVPDAPNGTVLAFIHGGRWSYGYKETAAFMAPAFNTAGIIFASIGHRLFPNRYADGFADVSRAIGWLAKNVADYGGDAQRIFVSGHSSGGHYAAQLAATRDWQAGEGVSREVIRGCLPISGVYDLTTEGYKGEGRPPCIEEGGDGFAESPVNRLKETPPPFSLPGGATITRSSFPRATPSLRPSTMQAGRPRRWNCPARPISPSIMKARRPMVAGPSGLWPGLILIKSSSEPKTA